MCFPFVVRKVRDKEVKRENVCKTHQKNVAIYAGYFYVETNEKEMIALKFKNYAKDTVNSENKPLQI